MRWLILLLLLSSSCEGCNERSDQIAIAECLAVEGEVRSHPAEKVVWSTIGVGQTLADGDWVRTAAESTTRIGFFSGFELSVDPSSTIVIREAEDRDADVVGQVSVKSGAFRGTLKRSKKRRATLVVATPSGRSVRVSARSEEVGFQVGGKANEVQITVVVGMAEILSDGKTATVAAGQSQLVGRDPVVPELPDAKVDDLLTPIDGAVLTSKLRRPIVTFRWKPVAGPYRLVVSKRKDLSRPVVEEETSAREARIQKLRRGIYYWNVFTPDRTLAPAPRKLVIRRRKPGIRGPRKLRWE